MLLLLASGFSDTPTSSLLPARTQAWPENPRLRLSIYRLAAKRVTVHDAEHGIHIPFYVPFPMLILA